MFCVFSISDSDKHFKLAIDEYIKRLGKSIKIENIKPSKNGSHEQIIKKDTENMISLIGKKYNDYNKIYLSKSGESLSTMQLVKTIGNQNTLFIIGGPYGLDEDMLKPYVDRFLSFGQITIQHGLAKLVLLEQLYRIETIKGGKEYHY